MYVCLKITGRKIQCNSIFFSFFFANSQQAWMLHFESNVLAGERPSLLSFRSAISFSSFYRELYNRELPISVKLDCYSPSCFAALQ